MSGRRHHTLPRFLLNGFASRKQGHESYTWVYRRGEKSGRNVNTRNVGVERDFYGKPGESSLDDQITALEGNLATIVHEIRSMPHGQRVESASVPALISHSCIRTSHIQRSLLQGTAQFLDRLESELTRPEILKAGLLRELKSDPRAAELLTRLQEFGMDVSHDWLLAQVMRQLGDVDVGEALSSSLMELKEDLPQALREAVREAMDGNIAARVRADLYRDLNWFVTKPRDPVVLGDAACLLETNEKRRFRTFDSSDGETIRVFLPVSSTAVLVGTRSRRCPVLDTQMNQWIARCSMEYFISSSELPIDSRLSSSIGVWAMVADEAEVSSIIEGIRPTLLGRS
jgi:hypothetical protein